MGSSTSYQAKSPDSAGWVNYTPQENLTWKTLYQRQMEVIKTRACPEYLAGLDALQLDAHAIPQLPNVNQVLMETTGWQVASVPALIPFHQFFELLSQRQFPAATFIRRQEDIDYLQEPDIFHEIFGHCPLLTNPVFADFSQEYGKLGLHASKQERIYLARLYWFTVEFGLIRRLNETKIYGAGILSSYGETQYALDDPKVEYRSFDVMEALRTPYRIDIFQPIYYVIDGFEQIFDTMNETLLPQIQDAIRYGDYAPTFEPKLRAVGDKHDC